MQVYSGNLHFMHGHVWAIFCSKAAPAELLELRGVTKKVGKLTSSLTLISNVYDDNGTLFVRDAHDVLFALVGSLYFRILL